MDHAWRGFWIALAVPAACFLLPISFAIVSADAAFLYAYVLAPQLAYLFPFAFAFKHSYALGWTLTLIEFAALAWVFGAWTRYRGMGMQFLLTIVGMAALWIIGRVVVAVVGLDLSLDVRM